ncbi:hypothetical protein MFLAVUS_001611 [Mucor flavus]|uniref:C3H1-type domain-containing protein n=1 Tax=Mucor flavus TaxID=439312 RepID=A0ABP9YMY9_9FUNG
MVLKMNQQRFLTIAGSASLVALAAFGIWKWSKHAPEKKTKRKDRQVDKDSKQSHSSVSTTDPIEEAEMIRNITEAAEKEREQKSTTEKPAAGHSSKVAIKQVEVKVEGEDKVEQVEVEEINVEEAKVEQVKIEQAKVEDAKVEQPLEEEIKETTKEVESSLELMTETIVVVEDKQSVAAVEEEEYVMVGKTAKKGESQSCATSSGDETGVWTPEHEPESKDNTPKNATTKEYIWKADSYVAPLTDEQKSWSAPVPAITTTATTTTTAKPLSSDAAVFVPRRQVQPKKSLRRRLTRPELIQQQRQNYTPHAKARCSHWPCCTNKNCKFWHPFRDCREGETCPFGNKCMFIHPSDYLEPVRGSTAVTQEDEEEQT